MVEHAERARPSGRLSLVSLALAAMLVAVTLSVPHAGAATPWQNFGSASAHGRGTLGNASVYVNSTTKPNPNRVRFTVSGTQIRTRISWNIFCWNESNFKSRSASGSFRTTPPFTKDISNGSWVSNFQFCNLDVSAYQLDPGQVSVKLQARYPS
jgi:hypothetical protein